MSAAHPDDLTLLLLLSGETSELETARLRRHLAGCPACSSALSDLDELDRTLKATLPELEAALSERSLPEGDPFRCRPDEDRPRRRPRRPTDEAVDEALAASRSADRLKERLLGAVRSTDDALREALAALDLLEVRDRFGLGYALDAALYAMVDGPARWALFGRASRDTVLAVRSDARSRDGFAEVAYPLDDLLGLSLLVEGTACNWTGDLVRGGRALRRSYGAFARGTSSDYRLASVELSESQRRAFLDRAEEALHLAERARLTFEALGLDDERARAAGAHALALSYLGRDEEALVEFRSTLPALAAAERWNAYSSVLNGIGGCLLRLGRPEEARREYARALRQVGRDARPAVHAFVRANLARMLFQAGRYEEAARAFENAAALFAALDARADEHSMALFRIEALARAGAREEARRSFAVFSGAVRSALDPELLESLESVLRGDIPDADLLARLRGRAETQLADRLRRAS